METRINTNDWWNRNRLHRSVWTFVDWTWKLAMAVLVVWALSWCSWNTFNSWLNDFGKWGWQLWEAWGKLLSSWSNLINGNLWDSWADFVQSVWNVWGAAVYWLSWATKVIVWTGKWVYEETIQSK